VVEWDEGNPAPEALTMRRVLCLSLLLLAGAGTAGCVAVAAGAAAGYGVVQYGRNADVRDYAGDLATVWEATLLALGEQGYPVAPSSPPAGRTASVSVNDASVSATEVQPGRIRVVVRIGTFKTDAHRRIAAAIHAGIQGRVPPAA
jgi:hypothetical protein